jgi:hypothetical protein
MPHWERNLYELCESQNIDVQVRDSRKQIDNELKDCPPNYFVTRVDRTLEMPLNVTPNIEWIWNEIKKDLDAEFSQYVILFVQYSNNEKIVTSTNVIEWTTCQLGPESFKIHKLKKDEWLQFFQ